MTNKMPVVGKRYRKKSDLNLPHCNIECVGFQRSFKEFYAFRFYNEENPNRIDVFSLNYFLENYEELLDSNSQETEEVEIGKTYRHLENGFNYKLAGIDSGNHAICIKLDENGNEVIPIVNEIPTVDKFWQMFVKNDKVNKTPNPVDFEKREVNEFDRALEKLKEEIKTNDPFGRNILSVEDYYRLKTAAQNLVNALEIEKSLSIGYKPLPDTEKMVLSEKVKEAMEKVEEEISSGVTVYPSLENNYRIALVNLRDKGQNFINSLNKFRAIEANKQAPSNNANDIDVATKDRSCNYCGQELLSYEGLVTCGKVFCGKGCAAQYKPDNQAVGEPLSIWKDVSELPRYHCQAFVKFKNHNQIFLYDCDNHNLIDYNGDELDLDYVKSFCLLTDFITFTESLAENQKKIEDRLKLLEGKCLE